MFRKGGMLKKILVVVGVAVAGIIAYNMFPKLKSKLDQLLSKVGIKTN